jgi:hypothetical protein
MRGLAKIMMVAGFVVLFGVAAWALSGWRADTQKSEAVVVLVDPPKVEADEEVIPLRGRASLYAGPAKEVTELDVSIDDAEEVNLETAEQPRFELNADASDGTRFFVYAWMEMSNYDIYCESIPLPRMRSETRGDTRLWVNADTGQPLEELRVALRKKCDDPQSEGG